MSDQGLSKCRRVLQPIDMGLLSGRSGRLAFWVFSGILLVCQTALLLITQSRLWAELLILLPSLLLWSRRFHDINISGWWAFTPMGVAFVEGFVDAFIARANAAPLAASAAVDLPPHWLDSALQYPMAFLTGFVAGFANALVAKFATDPVTATVSVAFTLFLGLWPGSPAANRFGPPPGVKAP
ncbi:MAG: DUF805 domain-containing protein [Hyphomonadaceae bacterium]